MALFSSNQNVKFNLESRRIQKLEREKSDSKSLKPFPLLLLPYELRRQIFWLSIDGSRSPDPCLIHETNLSRTWTDRPSPLLHTSKQIRDEINDLLQNRKLFTVRVTPFGVAFDMLSLSCLIVQGLAERNLPKSYLGLSGLQIEIWPPHDNPVRERLEMLYLHNHLQKLRDDLRVGPQISRLSIRLLESDYARWANWGEPGSKLGCYDWSRRDNAEITMDHFAFVTNVDKANIELPPSLQAIQDVVSHADTVVERIEKGFLPEEYDIYKEVTDTILKNPFYNGVVEDDAVSLEKSFINILRLNRSEGIDYIFMYRVWYGDHKEDEWDWHEEFKDYYESHVHVRNFVRTDGWASETTTDTYYPPRSHFDRFDDSYY